MPRQQLGRAIDAVVAQPRLGRRDQSRRRQLPFVPRHHADDIVASPRLPRQLGQRPVVRLQRLKVKRWQRVAQLRPVLGRSTEESRTSARATAIRGCRRSQPPNWSSPSQCPQQSDSVSVRSSQPTTRRKLPKRSSSAIQHQRAYSRRRGRRGAEDARSRRASFVRCSSPIRSVVQSDVERTGQPPYRLSRIIAASASRTQA